MSDDKSILLRMEEQGRPARRVELKGTERDTKASHRYEVVGELARGGIGAVHRGRDNDLGRDVALKVLLDRHIKSPELVQRFVEEAQIGGQLQHPGIVPVYELGLQSDERPYFAMKLVKGETLAARLDKGQDSRRALLAVFREVCRTVAYAHSRGVIHRDLKPSNVMIGNFGEVQVVDWGFAKVLRKGGVADERLKQKAQRDITMISTVRSSEGSDESLAGSVMGTPSYMPPEQAMGRVDELDERSDIFSLGAILCEILTGAPPYESDLTSAAQGLLEPAHRRLDKCGADQRLITLCQRCLKPLPKDRPADATELADEVAAYIAAAESRAHRSRVRAVKADAQAGELKRARRQTAIVGTTLAVLLGLAVGAFLWRDAAQTRRANQRQTAIDAALQDAERARAERKWPEALAAADLAIGLGDGGELARTIRAEAQAADAHAKREADDAAFLAALENARAVRGDEVDDVTTDKMYEAAVAKYGVDTERLRNSPRALAFAAVFDAWAQMRRTELEGSDWRTIDGYARAIDPEHDALRDALAARDREALTKLAESEKVLELPPALLGTIGNALRSSPRLKLMERALRKHPDDFWIQFRLASAAATKKDHDKAVVHYAAALAIRPQSIEARHRLGIALDRLEQYAEAVAVWQEAIAQKQDWGHGYAHVGTTLFKLGQHEEAEAAFGKAIELDPEDSQARVYFAWFLGGRGRFDDSVTQYREAVRLGHPGTDWRYDFGRVLLESGDLDGALDELRAFVDREPDHCDAWQTLGVVWERKGDFKKALNAHRKAAELPDATAQAFVNLGTLLSERFGRHDDALAAYRRAVKLAPQDASIRGGLAWALSLVGKHDEAARMYLEALALGPTANILANYGAHLCNAMKEYDAALVQFNKALDLDKNHAGAYGGRGYAYWGKGDLDRAEKEMRKSLKLKPRPDVYTNLGTLLCDYKHEYPAAIKEFEAALALDKTNVYARKNLVVAYTKLIEQFAGQRKWDAVLDAAHKAAEHNPKAAVHRHQMGMALQMKGEYEAALREYAQVLKLDPRSALTRLNISGIRLQLGRTKLGLDAMRHAFELNPRLAYSTNWAHGPVVNRRYDQAVAVLRLQLTFLEKRLATDRAGVGSALAFWKQDPALAPLRVDKFKKFWAEVDALLARAK